MSLATARPWAEQRSTFRVLPLCICFTSVAHPLLRRSQDSQPQHHHLRMYRMLVPARAIHIHHLRLDDKRVRTISRVSKSVSTILRGKSCQLLSRNTRSTMMIGKIMPCLYAMVPLVCAIDAFQELAIEAPFQEIA